MAASLEGSACRHMYKHMLDMKCSSDGSGPWAGLASAAIRSASDGEADGTAWATSVEARAGDSAASLDGSACRHEYKHVSGMTCSPDGSGPSAGLASAVIRSASDGDADGTVEARAGGSAACFVVSADLFTA